MNHKIILGLALFTLSTITFWSCEDIFITDLESTIVELVTPQNDFATTTQTQNFFWEELADADEYHLRIVSPSFDNPTDVILDETLTDNSYSTTLSAGTYQWRVLASNSASTTVLTNAEIRTLYILADSTLENQFVNVLSPTDNFATNQTNVDLLWQPLDLATEYRIQLASPDFSHSSFVISDITTSNDTYQLSNLTEGSYQWRIRAENTQSVSSYSTFNLEIDLTAPIAPILVSPTDGDTLISPITLSWTPASDAIGDSLYIYQASSSTTPILQIYIIDVNYDFSTSDFGTFIWKLKSFDAVGNKSAFSTERSFVIE